MRKTAAERGYGWRWQQCRLRFLRAHPLCASCLRVGRTRAAAIVDHIIPHRGDEALFWNEENWQSLCKQCHDSGKQAEEKSGYQRGCDIDGNPLDPNHHWS